MFSKVRHKLKSTSNNKTIMTQAARPVEAGQVQSSDRQCSNGVWVQTLPVHPNQCELNNNKRPLSVFIYTLTVSNNSSLNNKRVSRKIEIRGNQARESNRNRDNLEINNQILF